MPNSMGKLLWHALNRSVVVEKIQLGIFRGALSMRKLNCTLTFKVPLRLKKGFDKYSFTVFWRKQLM